MTTDIIKKSGVIVEGVEISSEHIGQNLEVVESNESRYLPKGFISEVLEVSNGGMVLLDTGNERSNGWYLSDKYITGMKFKWVDRSLVALLKPPVKQVSENVRGKKAKALREAWEAKEKAICEYEKLLSEAQEESVGLVVSEGIVAEGEGCRKLIISYSAPTKFYN
tara:strand:+ start:5526 stop:6023 length:498 start_codon:yes stop_codon:yes gene_type:complete